ncbi:MAG: hypothetical protein NTW72_10705 [Gemmatimonadetes bacterium]|nr:hypothetical protein [Gemmatimonadota bacterium]
MIQPLLLLCASAALYSDLPAVPTNATFRTTPRPALLHADTSASASLMHRQAERLWSHGDINGARTMYRTAIAYQDSVGVFPGEVLWALAQLEFGLGRELRAAEVLDEAAAASQRYGRPDWEARSVLEAGLLYQTHGRTDLSVARYRALKTLLSSPAIGDSLRAQLAGRIAAK